MGDGRILLSAYCFFYGSHTVVSSTAGIEPARFDFKSKEFGFAVCTYKFDQLRSKNPPRFELGIEDSKSSVLTTTLWVQKTTLQGKECCYHHWIARSKQNWVAVLLLYGEIVWCHFVSDPTTMSPAGFEPAPPKRTDLKSVALDHSAKGTFLRASP